MSDKMNVTRKTATLDTQEIYIDIKMVQCDLEKKECRLLDINNRSIDLKNIDTISHVYPSINIVSSKNNFRTDFEKGAICSTDIFKLDKFKLNQLNCISND